MNGNYEISAIAFSLKAMCASKVAHQALVASGIKSSDISTQASIATDAMKRVRQLELPVTLISMVEFTIGPLKRELTAWYLLSPEDPVYMPQGTVDTVQGVRAIIANENVDSVHRFTLACDYCIEEVIFKMFDQYDLRNPISECRSQLKATSSPFVKFWLDAVLYKSVCSVSGNHLEVEAYNVGFELGLRKQNDIALRHFIDKADGENVCLHLRAYLHYSTGISPSTYCLLFSKLGESYREVKEDLYWHVLLKSLMNWPYQCFLTDHVLSFARLLDPMEIYILIRNLIEKIQNGEHHLNYHKLMAIFLELHFKCDYPIFSHNCDIVYELLMFKDEQLINIIVNKMPTKRKDKLLLEFSTDRVFFRLIEKMEFRLLKIFISGCVMHRKCMLSHLKSSFLKSHQELIGFVPLNEMKKLDVKKQMLVRMVNEIASEKRPLE